ncbi:alpha/beta hydrolase-fold protein [Nocardia callitridis]|uniref:Alpha/beta hydrolase-fold protein n=1 Tax=Nocardia callitridis TaxID=648753 RepID=A0ABP9K9R6_9NOCA
MQGWLPPTVEAVAAIALGLAIARITKRWWLIQLPVCLLVGVGAALLARWYVHDQGLSSDPAPTALWLCVAAVATASAVTVVGWPRTPWWRRGVALLAIPLTLLSAALVVNQWVGYYPTVQAALNAFTAGPLPHETDEAGLATLRGTDIETGRVVPVQIPEDDSHFAHRTEYVYLPPAWFTGPTPPALPVVMMIGGEFNTPADWLRSGQIMPTVDKFTAEHAGQAPIMVFVDASGSFNNDTECVNGPRGNAADHLTEDVPKYVESTFGASTDPAKWAAVGWSMGGTCAVDLAVTHPELLHTFVDIAGDLGPSTGDHEHTVARLFGGDERRWAEFDPSTVMAAHGPYTQVAGLFDDLTPPRAAAQPPRGPHPPPVEVADADAGIGGRDAVPDTGEVGAAETLCARGRSVGIDCAIHTTEGEHTWQFAAESFTSSLPWLTERLGLAAPPTR